MSKTAPCTSPEEAFEIIELSIDSCDTLTKAFNLIVDICEEGAKDSDSIEASEQSPLVH